MGRRWAVGVALLGLVLAGVAVAVGNRTDDRLVEDRRARPPLALPTDPQVAHGQSLVGPASSSAGRVSDDSLRVTQPPLTLPLGPFDPAGLGVAQTAALAVEVPAGRFEAAFDRAVGAASAAGGLVVASTSSSGPSGSSASGRPSTGQLLMRVPADRFDATRRELTSLGTLEGQLTRAEDVTRQVTDQMARLRALDAEDPRNRAQVEQLQAQIKRLEEAAKVATISVQLSEAGVWSEQRSASGLRLRGEQAVRGAVAVLGGMLVVAGWSAPVVVLLAVVLAAVRWRRREAAVSQ